MPVEIFLAKENAEQEYETIDESDLKEDDVVVERIHEEAKTKEIENEDGTKETKEISPVRDRVKINKRPVSLSDTSPLWAKHPNECTEEEYKEFYRKVFHDYKEPLFWIHLNMDYPFNLKGILYFPKINLEYESAEGVIKLYNNQVFIADNIKEVIPEFLMLLKGVIDCPDLPLNVSRSALQNDGFVKKISDYITKKVADKLSGMCKTDRENYEKYWDDISPFIKYGCIKDEKFCERMMEYVLFKDLDGKYTTMSEYLDALNAAEKTEEGETAETVEGAETAAEGAEAESRQTAEESGEQSVENADGSAADDSDEEEQEPPKTTIYYVTDEVQQSQYINMFREQSMNAVVLKDNIDSPFISHLEAKNEKVKFQCIDADLTESMKEETSEEELKDEVDALSALFRKALNNDKLEVKVEKLKNENVSSMITLSEESRRMQDMMKMYNMYGMDSSMFGNETTLVLNANNALVKYLFENPEGEHTNMICEQLYDLAMISHEPLAPEAMTKFVARTNEIMLLLTK
ncbi:MAG: molecular chaperone HtpG, partial [Lachnospiraceae bacterium]|nr:molecular chaperone HtpG [Lachnospiraceae bacterium]